MKFLLVFAALIFVVSGSVLGQAGGIALFSDPAYIDCFFFDDHAALITIYAVHVATPVAVACQWMVAEGDGFG
jgi:hypothetical protein